MKTIKLKEKAAYEAPVMESTVILAESCLMVGSPYQSGSSSPVEYLDLDGDDVDW